MKRVYFQELNVGMGDVSYLPLVSGLLRAYAETIPEVKSNYEFMPFIYRMALPSEILANYTEKPDVAAFSSVSWNEQLNYAVAREVKRRWPDCLVVFGGPNVPMPPQHDVEEWMGKYPFVDVAVRAAGEEAFSDILLRLLDEKDFRDIPSVAGRDGGEIYFCNKERPHKRDISELPSPYLEGLYDYLIEALPGRWQSIIETNRGCPFPCAFCYWGAGGFRRKMRYYNMDRIFAEIDWMGRNKILYCMNADANFGINARDYEIAEFIVAIKNKYNYPDKFRTCFSKNTDDKIFKIGALFHANNLEKGITLARQSNDATALENARRSNIKMSTYVNLQKRFNDENIPVYAELILGLPGETVESWKRGVDELLEAGTRNQIFIYFLAIFSNTEMAEKPYREKFKIETRKIKLTEIHCSQRPPEWVDEYEEIVVATYSMTIDEWRQMVRFSYVLMLFHSLKLAYYVMIYLLDEYGIKMSAFLDFVSERKFKSEAPLIRRELDFYDEVIDRLLNRGEQRGSLWQEYGDTYWDMEEISFLRLTQHRGGDWDSGGGWSRDFYLELAAIVDELAPPNSEEVAMKQAQAVAYNSLVIPAQSQLLDSRSRFIRPAPFDWNFPEYFAKRFSSQEVKLEKKPQAATFTYGNHGGDKRRFARETILWGRKSGTMLIPCEWRNA